MWDEMQTEKIHHGDAEARRKAKTLPRINLGVAIQLPNYQFSRPSAYLSVNSHTLSNCSIPKIQTYMISLGTSDSNYQFTNLPIYQSSRPSAYLSAETLPLPPAFVPYRPTQSHGVPSLSRWVAKPGYRFNCNRAIARRLISVRQRAANEIHQ